MKLVKAYIRPKLLEDVYTALRREGFCCMSVFEGEGTGQYNDPNKKHGSLTFPAMHTRTVKLEIAAENNDVNKITEIILSHAKTGKKGDGLVFVTPIEHASRIRDGKHGARILN